MDLGAVMKTAEPFDWERVGFILEATRFRDGKACTYFEVREAPLRPRANPSATTSIASRMRRRAP